MKTTDKTKPIYMVWVESNPLGHGCFEQYASLQDAIQSNYNGVEIYFARPKRLGKFKMHTGVKRVKVRKRRKK